MKPRQGPRHSRRPGSPRPATTARGGGGRSGPGCARGWERRRSRGAGRLAGLMLSLLLCGRHLGILNSEGRGLGPIHPLAILTQESSVRELGPTGCCPSSFTVTGAARSRPGGAVPSRQGGGLGQQPRLVLGRTRRG